MVLIFCATRRPALPVEGRHSAGSRGEARPSPMPVVGRTATSNWPAPCRRPRRGRGGRSAAGAVRRSGARSRVHVAQRPASRCQTWSDPPADALRFGAEVVAHVGCAFRCARTAWKANGLDGPGCASSSAPGAAPARGGTRRRPRPSSRSARCPAAAPCRPRPFRPRSRTGCRCADGAAAGPGRGDRAPLAGCVSAGRRRAANEPRWSG